VLNPLIFTIGGALLLIGLGFKVAAVPFHMWTPDVYEGAPSAVTAFMAAGAKAAGFAALLRVFVIAMPSVSVDLTPVIWVIAALTMIVGNVSPSPRPTSSVCWRIPASLTPAIS
jgi:NADH-quinone oxidoreductase subunit N